MVSVAAGLCLLLVAGRLLYPARSDYRTLERNVYFPTFFVRAAEARRQGAAWARDARAVALAYVGTTRECTTQEVRERSVAVDRVVFTITRKCPYRAAPVKQFRLDLVRQAGFWEIEWAGLREKCASSQNPVGAYLIQHTTPRSYGWVLPAHKALKSSSELIEPWKQACL
jgi:hypothetical protein